MQETKWFSKWLLKTNTKVILNYSDQSPQTQTAPIRIPDNYQWLAKSAGKLNRTCAKSDWFLLCLSKLLENWCRILHCNHVITFNSHLKTFLIVNYYSSNMKKLKNSLHHLLCCSDHCSGLKLFWMRPLFVCGYLGNKYCT